MARTFTSDCRTRLAHAEKATLLSQRGLYLCRQRPTLPHTFACSTIGPAGLNFRVRYGNGWIPRGMITDNSKQLLAISSWLLALSCHAEERLLHTSARASCKLDSLGLRLQR